MSNELTITSGWGYAKGGRNRTLVATTVNEDVSGTGVADSTQTIGTSAESLVLGDVSAPGFAYFKNLDPTNFVEIGYDIGGFQPFLKLEPGQFAYCYIATAAATIQAKADTSDCLLEYMVLDA